MSNGDPGMEKAIPWDGNICCTRVEEPRVLIRDVDILFLILFWIYVIIIDIYFWYMFLICSWPAYVLDIWVGYMFLIYVINGHMFLIVCVLDICSCYMLVIHAFYTWTHLIYIVDIYMFLSGRLNTVCLSAGVSGIGSDAKVFDWSFVDTRMGWAWCPSTKESSFL